MLAHWPLGEDRLVLIAAAGAELPPIDAAWLQRARWVMREPGSGTRSTLNDGLRTLGIDPNALHIVLVLPSNESARTAVEAGAGIAALSSLVVVPAINAGRLQALQIDLGPRSFFGLRHKERYRTRAADALLELIAELRPFP